MQHATLGFRLSLVFPNARADEGPGEEIKKWKDLVKVTEEAANS